VAKRKPTKRTTSKASGFPWKSGDDYTLVEGQTYWGIDVEEFPPAMAKYIFKGQEGDQDRALFSPVDGWKSMTVNRKCARLWIFKRKAAATAARTNEGLKFLKGQIDLLAKAVDP